MKRKRIQYNELSEDIYGPKYWSVPKLVILGIVLLMFGFIFNFPLESKINKWLFETLSTNDACPVQFEKSEITYFLPELLIKRPVFLGACFGQVENTLPLQNIRISLSAPSFYPPGIKLHITATAGKSKINLYPVISLSSQIIEIEETTIDTQLFAAMTSDNISPVAGTVSIEGFFKLAQGTIVDGQLKIKSDNFYLPAQNIKGFELTMIDLKHLSINAHFVSKTNMEIEQLEIGQGSMPIDLKLKGNLLVNANSFASSQLQLSGSLHLSPFILTNFSFLKLFLPPQNTSGTYQMRINGPLSNLGTPQFN
jgi:hypothetical protein